MSDYKITLDYSNQAMAMDQVNEALAKVIHAAVGRAAEMVHDEWDQRVRMASGIRYEEKNAYRASIKHDYTGPFSASVWTDYKIADEIETGRPARDLKRMLQTSTKVRRTNDGRRFLVIPIRHNTTGNTGHASDMPSHINAMAEALSFTKVMSTGMRPSGEVTNLVPRKGMSPSSNQTPFLSNPSTRGQYLVPKSVYEWGSHIPRKMLQGNEKRIYGGMVKTHDSTQNKSAGYLTLRIMMEGSSGWVIPAQPGKYIARQLATDIQPDIEKIISDSLT